MKSIVWLFSLLLFSPQSFASTTDTSAPASINCTEYLRRHGSFKFHRFQAEDGSCFLGADPFNVGAEMIYRSYLLTGDGQLMVFNSYSTEENSSSTGARVFYFFPRNSAPDITERTSHTELSFATAGLALNLSQEKARVISMIGGSVHESSRISPNNEGGVEFSNVKALYLDAGFEMGQDPTSDPTRTSTFIDSRGRRCKVKNSEIFQYLPDGDNEFKFSDADLKVFLKDRCSNLTVNY